MEKSYPAINFWLGTVFQCLGQIIGIFHTSYDTALVFHLVSKIKARETISRNIIFLPNFWRC